MINLGNKIRELRKKRGITQEQLASALNLSPQAISKWEMGAGYPDVATLPVLAGYFGVSLDAMFDYDPEKLEEKIRNILIKSRVEAHSFEDSVRMLREGIAAYPGGYILKRELLECFADHLTDTGTDYTEEALDIAKQLIAECQDTYITLGAKGDMARIYIQSGQYDKGKEIIESMSYVYNLDIQDRMRCAASMLKGTDRLPHAQELKIWETQDLWMACGLEGDGYWEIGDWENALLSFEEAADVNERFCHRKPREGLYPLCDEVSQGVFTVKMAACLYKLGRLTECDAALDKALQLLKDHVRTDIRPDFYLDFYREPYHKYGLDEYKPCL